MQPIKLKNKEIISILRELNADKSLYKSTEKTLPVFLLFSISKNVKALSNIHQVIAEQEQAINNEYFTEEKSETNEEGLLEIKPEFRNEFLSKKNELLEIENEVNIDMIKIHDIDTIQFTPAEFQSIAFMVTDED